MLTHKDPEVQAMLGLLESQRDHVMGVVAAQAKQINDLLSKIAELEAISKNPEN
jgi:flagellar hook-associated protein FlgK